MGGDDGWDEPAVLALVERVAARRAEPGTQALEGYSAVAEGHIHFFLDRDDGGDPVPLRVDQVSLDVHWRPPNQVRQEVRAYRKKNLVPLRDFDYYLDRYTVIGSGFEEWIRVGDARDVRAVPHPLAPRFTDRYRYRLGDSVLVTLPSADTPVRVQEVLVRPVDPDRPAVVGSLYLDPDRGALVRMVVTFTPSSYVDRRDERVHLALHNGLWEGRLWLPHRQELEVRRRLPELDLGAAAVIRADLRVTGYRFDAVPDPVFLAAPVVLPEDGVGDTTRFASGLLDAVAAEGREPWDPARLETEAEQAMRAAASRGLPPVRPWVPGISGVVRANRAEGWYLGGGVVWEVDDRRSLRTTAGYRSGPSWPSVSTEFRWRTPGARLAVRAYLDQARDLGLVPTTSGAMNTLGFLLTDTDRLDLHYARGVGASLDGRTWAGQGLTLGARVERHRSAERTWGGSGDGDRPVRAVDPGTLVEARVQAGAGGSATAGPAVEHDVVLEGGVLEGRGYGRVHGQLRVAYRDAGLRELLSAGLRAGTSTGPVPAQRLFLLGGQGTLPGFPYRGFVGRSFALASVEGRVAVLADRVGLRGFGGVGATWNRPTTLPHGWARVTGTAGPRGTLGVGLGLAGDVVRVDLARGLGPGGAWEVVVAVDPRLWPFL